MRKIFHFLGLENDFECGIIYHLPGTFRYFEIYPTSVYPSTLLILHVLV